MTGKKNKNTCYIKKIFLKVPNAKFIKNILLAFELQLEIKKLYFFSIPFNFH